MHGARRSKRNPKVNPHHPAYRVVFSGWPEMRERLRQAALGADPAPGLSSCRNLELAVAALAAGEPPPLVTGELNGGVERALVELFALRDMSAVS